MFKFWGCGCKDIQQIQKRCPPKNVFGNSEFCSSHQNHNRPNSLENCDFGRKNKTQSFQKNFSGDIFFVFVEYLCNCSPKIKTKNIKNYSSVLAIVNHRNWLDDSLPLRPYSPEKNFEDLFVGDRLKFFLKTFFIFFGEHFRLFPWSLVLSSSIHVLGLERVCPQKACPWPWLRMFFCVLGLEPCVLDSTSDNLVIIKISTHATTTFVLCFYVALSIEKKSLS